MRTEGSTDSDKWVWQTKYTCLPRHQLSRTQSSITAECLYDADYYDSRWSHEPPTCQGKFFFYIYENTVNKWRSTPNVVEKLDSNVAQYGGNNAAS